jgi:hypothetical protein
MRLDGDPRREGFAVRGSLQVLCPWADVRSLSSAASSMGLSLGAFVGLKLRHVQPSSGSFEGRAGLGLPPQGREVSRVTCLRLSSCSQKLHTAEPIFNALRFAWSHAAASLASGPTARTFLAWVYSTALIAGQWRGGDSSPERPLGGNFRIARRSSTMHRTDAKVAINV